MPVNDAFSELDLAVLDAIQVNPRASWSLIGSVLEVDPVTVARRWARLHQDGSAWVTVFLGRNPDLPFEISYITVNCEHGAGARVAQALARRSNVVTVQHLAGASDLYVIVIAADAAAMADQLLVELPSVDGITNINTYLSTRTYEATGRWRLRVLGEHQVRRLGEHVDLSAARTRPFGRHDRDLFRALSRNGRRPHTEIAEEIGSSVRKVQRRVTALCARQELTFRCDVARPALGWPSAALLWLNVPDDRLDEAAISLSSLPELRTVAALADERNLLVSVGLQTIAELHKVLPVVAAAVPYARIVDRVVALRTDKLCGHLLDRHGRSRGVVPLDPWATGEDGGADRG